MTNKTQITKLHNDWVDIKNECRTTVNKEATNNEPSREFIKKLLISEHSPIRLFKVKWKWNSIKSWVATQLSRHHTGWEKWIGTQRVDRTGIDRDNSTQDVLVPMSVQANAQALINVGRYRLCYQSSDETRGYMEDLKCTLKSIEPELSDVMVPNCIYRAGCPEFSQCGYWVKFLTYCEVNDLDTYTIQERYDAYNQMFHEVNNNK